MFTKFKKTLRYLLIWKEKNVVEFDFKKKRIVVPRAKVRQNVDEKNVAGGR